MDNLRPNTKKDIEKILFSFKKHKFNRIKTAYLLIKLRPYVDKGVLFDIASFIAHDKRTMGITHKNARIWLDKVLLIMKPKRQKNGLNLITRGEFLTTQELFIEQIENLLSDLGFEFKFGDTAHLFMKSVLENISEAKLEIKGERGDLINEFSLSIVQKDREGRFTVYAKLTPKSNGIHQNKGIPQLTMDGESSIGLPLLQAHPPGTHLHYDLYVYINQSQNSSLKTIPDV